MMAWIYNIKQIIMRLWRGNKKHLNNTNRPKKRNRGTTPFYRNKHGYPENLRVCERDDEPRT
jgi:hypothetical protein